MALFYDVLRATLSPPRLLLTLRETVDLGDDVETLGEGTLGEGTIYEHEHRARVWWFHLRVASGRRRVVVHGVRVVLSRVEDDKGNRLWEGEMPMKWGLEIAQQLTVGPTWLADLCALYADRRTSEGADNGRVLLLQPVRPTPYNLPLQVKALKPVVLTLQARGDEVDSNVLRVRIAWDGEWGEDEAARKKHLSVAVVD